MNEHERPTVVHVSGGGGEVGASIASFAALVCAPHDGTSARDRRRRELEEAVLLQLEELRARRDRAARR